MSKISDIIQQRLKDNAILRCVNKRQQRLNNEIDPHITFQKCRLTMAVPKEKYLEIPKHFLDSHSNQVFGVEFVSCMFYFYKEFPLTFE